MFEREVWNSNGLIWYSIYFPNQVIFIRPNGTGYISNDITKPRGNALFIPDDIAHSALVQAF